MLRLENRRVLLDSSARGAGLGDVFAPSEMTMMSVSQHDVRWDRGVRNGAAGVDVLEAMTARLGEAERDGQARVWRLSKFGRACLVYLHTWSNGSQTVTTCDSARTALEAVVNIDIGTIASLDALRAEMDSLTTWKGAAVA